MAQSRAPAAAATGGPVPPPPRQQKRDYGTLPTTQQHEELHQVGMEAAATTAPAKRRLVEGWVYLVLFVLLYSGTYAHGG